MSPVDPTREYAGLVAAVTGGGAGIGLAVVVELVARGARVAALDVDPSGAPDGVLGVRCDVTDRASVDAAIATVVRELGQLDVVVNNAGISAVGSVEDLSDEDWRRVLDVNVVGIARVSAAALPHLRDSEAAAIVNTCSIAAQVGLPQRALYAASKGAVLAMTFAMATDHVGEGVRVNCVCPGTVHTGFVDRLLATFPDPEKERAAMGARQAIGRMVTPEEVAYAVAYLGSPRAGSTTGTALDVDGGATHLRARAVQKRG
ncbi:NAD(P)-dependent dehydrogenase, short-chain alcohol dehydrogenase family [Microlunatus sagamiharensis]|uniref:NAD(P)-dependent dehydrogenase, short-chain alcohol dehydrogenase family n=1 Tax=Microlunatus sagamiharensis TaxID=546874 RepID=A0A1H2MEI6_9ACTN|nr:SDR family oxidoreductase [Microlunatus sagamiharensis]SDU91653.1 NAD(P)-dependent dehydrogenase, short-chain alcohol dehydrogenase family [Microlunatus sagamiharensis]